MGKSNWAKKEKNVLGLDPAYRTGCKIAVIDSNGNVLDRTVIFPTPPQNKIEEAEAKLTELINKHKVDVISIGNGTASKESEMFVANLIKKQTRKVEYAVVNEAGASVYSASKLGAEEFPDFDVRKIICKNKQGLFEIIPGAETERLKSYMQNLKVTAKNWRV